MRKIVIFCMVFFSLYGGEYELGKGVQVGSLPLYLGGYVSLDYKNQNDENRYRLDDIAVMGYGSYEKLSYMAEFEFKEFYVDTEKDAKHTIEKDNNLHTERVYVDYNFDENYMLRVGKYNSQIGYWNLLPVNVLRETTSNPVSTEIIFPKFTTGLGGSYSSFDEGEFKVEFMLQHNKDLDDSYNNYKIDEHYGLGIMYEIDEYSIKLNSGYFENMDAHSDEDKRYYFLLSGKYEAESYQIQAELGSQESSEYRSTTPYAGYVQGAYRFDEHHIGIVRVESYEDKVVDKQENIGIVGYTYRPIYPVAIKTEYQLHSQKDENQFLFSLSVMF